MTNRDSIEQQYSQQSIKTADNLRNVAHTLMQTNVSRLTLPEVNQAVSIVSDMVPAGNVPGVILNGLARLSGKRLPEQNMKRDIHLLFRGVTQVLDQAVYGTLFAGPAAVIWGYQNLLKLAGKAPEDAFPEGTWQFYVNYALREDKARHSNETHGFDTLLSEHGIQLSAIQRATAWVITAVHIVNQYSELLENEWRERIYTRMLYHHMADSDRSREFAKLYSQWERQRPYGRRADAGQDTYPVYRRRLFDQFIRESLARVPKAKLDDWRKDVETFMSDALPAYQKQMSILSYLDPGEYGETRVSYPLHEAKIGLIHNGAYYLIPVALDERNLTDIATVYAQVTAIFTGQVRAEKANLTQLAQVHRGNLSAIRKDFSPDTQKSLTALQFAPIIINTDRRDVSNTLADIRQTERGVGDHALTIFDTGKTFVFDQSHIYFDGAWGAALAEIMTNEALSWARYLAMLPESQSMQSGIQPLNMNWQHKDLQRIAKISTIPQESSAESDKINIGAMLTLRKTFKQRSDLLQLTVNDLMVLYRAIHAVTYQQSQSLISTLTRMNDDPRKQPAVQKALSAIKTQDNPAILIPVDASAYSPSERLYPMSFEVPLYELDLINLHQQTVSALQAYRSAEGDRSTYYQKFDNLQRNYLATLAGFGAVLTKAKDIATSGESASVGTIKLLAHMPPPLQKLLDGIPSRFDVLNDIIKGKEVFSNVGAVASSSTLTRFITAKDDNEKKTLAWGVITDANRVMRISLRDFRPHVELLITIGEKDVAHQIVQEYLDSYVQGLNNFIRELQRITLASRETRIVMENMDE